MSGLAEPAGEVLCAGPLRGSPFRGEIGGVTRLVAVELATGVLADAASLATGGAAAGSRVVAAGGGGLASAVRA
jgi:hypothetical protein